MLEGAYRLVLLLLAAMAALTVPIALMAQAWAGWGLNQLGWSAAVALLSLLIPAARRDRPVIGLVVYLVLFFILAYVQQN